MPEDVVAHRQSQTPRLLELVVRNLHEEGLCGNPGTWTLWVALRGFARRHTATFIEKVEYGFESISQQNNVTAYPPFFSLQGPGRTTFTVRCIIHWNALLGKPPTQVDHELIFNQHDGNQTTALVEIDPIAMQTMELDAARSCPNDAVQHHELVFKQPDGNQTTAFVEIDPIAMQTMELDAARSCPNNVVQQHLLRQKPNIGVSVSTICALGLDVSRGQATSNSMAKLASSVMPAKPLPSNGKHFCEVVVGNHHKGLSEHAVGDLCHEWTMYVMLPEFQASKEMIEYVVYNVHPACSPDRYIKRPPKLELTKSSKETFSVNCTIHWNTLLGLQPTVVVHDLVFADIGGALQPELELVHAGSNFLRDQRPWQFFMRVAVTA
eukprot:CAMPEP_0172783524 /NCGR_PEP_ID=MMETSP1074-20121228/204476_1 /TAXON_ID=2916 /ORGANISM="Ceratium fusus, Strain PA161109" /LENGTH=379 /DNA_ID=CAMNT_0013620515 /DNA_START=237 /DNA_END=1377 /DNA_ORIENTATION=-